MSEVAYAIIGGVSGGLITLAVSVVAAVRIWAERGVKLAELRRDVRQANRDADDLEQRVRQIKEELDRHIGASRRQTLCTRSKAGNPDSEG